MGQTTRKYSHVPLTITIVHHFIQEVRAESLPLIDVYYAEAWSVMSPLTERSLAARSAAMDFPDLTRGKWRTWKFSHATSRP